MIDRSKHSRPRDGVLGERGETVNAGRLVTLLTDFGLDQHYVGVMKGVILGLNPDARIVDISHGVPPFDILTGAMILSVSYRYFPPGTVHVAVVDPGVGSERRGLLAATENYYFVGPDNGLFTSVYGDPTFLWVRELRAADYFLPQVSGTFHGRDVFAPVAGRLSAGEPSANFGPLIRDPVLLDRIQASVEPSGIIQGEVISVDRFGNLITNVDIATFWEACTRLPDEKDSFLPIIEIGGVTILGMSEFYQDTAPGDLGAHFNSWSSLEIFIPQGSASQELGVGRGERIRVRVES